MTYSTRTTEKFYKFTTSMAKKLRQADLSAAEWRFWSYLTVRDPWGDKYVEVDPLEIMAECDMSKTTYYRAKAKLQDLGLFDFQESKVSFRNLTGLQEVEEPILKNETVVPKMGQDSQNDGKVVPKMGQEQQERENEVQKRENQTPKPIPSKGFKITQTLKTYSDLLNSLSEGMRERFEKFCLKKIEESSFKIASRKSWLNKHGEEYLQEFKETYSEALERNLESTGDKSEAPAMDIVYLQKLYGTDWENAAIHFGLLTPNSSAVENEELDLSW
jgi:hypothetical protein